MGDHPALELPLLPLRDVVVYPHMVLPLFVGRERSIEALEHAMAAHTLPLEALGATAGYGGRGYGRVAVRIAGTGA